MHSALILQNVLHTSATRKQVVFFSVITGLLEMGEIFSCMFMVTPLKDRGRCEKTLMQTYLWFAPICHAFP